MKEWLECVSCHARYPIMEVRYECACGDLLSVEREPQTLQNCSLASFDARRGSHSAVDSSGVWRFREAVMDIPASEIVTHPEGGTRHYVRSALAAWSGCDGVSFKHEGENPTSSFKDRGMTAAVTQAVRVGATAIACASTGNTSASLAAYAAQAGLKAIVFLPDGKVSAGKLSQTLAYGATCLAVRGDFDAAMRLVNDAARALGIYLVNSKNPFRIEGQKTIVWEILQDLDWDPPDWISLPAGNLGNTAAFGKALREAYDAGWIRKIPRLLCVQAKGANPFARGFKEGFATRHRMRAETIATAIRIGDPVSWDRAKLALAWTNGVVTDLSDAEIMEAKHTIDKTGIGCEPASACSLAGVRQQIRAGVIKKHERVVCVLTGNVLKDPQAEGAPIVIAPTIAAVQAVLAGGQ